LFTTDDTDETLAWRRARWLEVIAGDLHLEKIVGQPYHLELMREPGVAALAKHFNRQLGEALARKGHGQSSTRNSTTQTPTN
jgi:hypothetical protein